MKVASVIIDSRTRQVDKGYSYRIPDALHASVVVGVRVRVPFGGGNRHEVGYVIKVEEQEGTAKIKEIAEVLDVAPLFNREKLLEAYWIKNRYFSTFADAIKLFLPPGSAASLTEWVHLVKRDVPMDNTEKKVADMVAENGEICASLHYLQYLFPADALLDPLLRDFDAEQQQLAHPRRQKRGEKT